MDSKNLMFDIDLHAFADLGYQLTICDSNESGDEAALKNFRKAINTLKDIENRDYSRHKCELLRNKLLKLAINISLHCESKQVIDQIIKEDLYLKFQQFVVNESIKTMNFDYLVLLYVYGTLNNLTDQSIEIARQNHDSNNFYKLASFFLDYLSQNIQDTINNNIRFGLYNRLVNFISNNFQYREIRSSLIGNSFIRDLANKFYLLRNFQNEKKEIKYVLLSITRAYSYLLSENLNDASISVHQIVDQLIDALNECIINSKTNALKIRNSKYYIEYSIGDSHSFHHILGLIECVQIIAENNHEGNQKFFENGILDIIDKILINGNEAEKNHAKELHSTLLKNENVFACIKNKLFKDSSTSSDDPIFWTKDKVQNWLKNKGLNSLAVVFENFDGTTINSLWEMKQKHYKKFLSFIEKQIEKSKIVVDDVEILNFSKLIDQLFSVQK